MGVARFLRCIPWGTSGFDPVPETLPSNARWWLPWTYAATGTMVKGQVSAILLARVQECQRHGAGI